MKTLVHMWEAARKAVELDLGPMYDRQTNVIQRHRLMPPSIAGGDIII